MKFLEAFSSFFTAVNYSRKKFTRFASDGDNYEATVLIED